MTRRPEVGVADRESTLGALAATFRGNYKTAEELAQALIRQAILSGVYRPGEKISQDAIANVLGVSRIPVRAGLRQLEAEGLLTLAPHRGATVTVLGPEEVRELYGIRGMLEARLLELTMKNMTAEPLAELRALAAELDGGVGSAWGSMDDIERRAHFYRRLYELAELPRTLRLVEQLREEVGRYLLMLRVHSDAHSHVDLVDLIAAGDRRGAQRWLSQHLSDVSAAIQRELIASQDLPEAP
jgi:DNA-binding GntR family transcriptional regulator